MDCAESRRLIYLSLDGELDAASELALAAHGEACADCRQFRQDQARPLAAIRRNASYHRAPPLLRQRIDGALPAGSVPAPGTRRWWIGWRLLNGAGLVAAVCAAIALAVLLPQRPTADERLAEEIVAGHARALLTGHDIDVASSDQHTVKPWFNGRVDYSPPVRDLAAQGFPLVGGRLDYIDHRLVAVVVYKRRQHVIDVFIRPAGGVGDVALPALTRQGYHVLGKVSSGMEFRVVSDVDPGELRQFLELL